MSLPRVLVPQSGSIGIEKPWLRPSRTALVAIRAEPLAHLVDRDVDGYRDDGQPGPRPQYSPDYYGSFLLDPDGNNIEAVLREFD